MNVVLKSYKAVLLHEQSLTFNLLEKIVFIKKILAFTKLVFSITK